jgi:hypothetical protein
MSKELGVGVVSGGLGVRLDSVEMVREDGVDGMCRLGNVGPVRRDALASRA